MAAQAVRTDAAPLGWVLEAVVAVRELPPVAISGLALDSRDVAPGDLFLACAGTRAHGGRHAAEAVRRGAVAVAFDPAGLDAPLDGLGVPTIPVPALGECIGAIAHRFFGEPSRELTVIGVTGTNGKTSCSHYLAQALTDEGPAPGVLGTLGYGAWDDLAPATHTTPDAVTVHRWLRRFRDAGRRHTVLEVSSHALSQGRVGGVIFDAAVWTNLSRDHLDYHGDMTRYAEAKARLFAVPGLKRAVVNGDDAWGRWLLARLPAAVDAWEYGLDDEAASAGQRVQGSDLRLGPDGLRLRVATPAGAGELRSPLWGRINAQNLLATLGTLLALGLPLGEALDRLARVRAVPGRLERFDCASGALAVVDYAHTPDALARALETLRAHAPGRLICVFGCGGDRDRGKRPEMGAAAAAGADRLILTDDNPRHEDPERIVAEIRAGVPAGADLRVIRDRAEAIAAALAEARAGDVVLVAGKGHEDTQTVGDEVRPFSDRAWVTRLAAEGHA